VSTHRLPAVAALVVVAALLVSLGRPAPAAVGGKAVLDVGDSLSVGAAPYLPRHLPGYRIDGYRRVGLRSDEAALRVIRAQAPLPRVVVVSAGTNDDPHDVVVFSRSVADVLATVGRSRCVVWPTIVRPAVSGLTYAALNRVLRRAATRRPNLVLVDWVGMVRRNPGWLGHDGVHASSAGYRARARAIGAAVKTRCSS
jgi:hypothetical protein